MAAALALGASGVWCGSVWLTTEESDTSPDLQQKLIAASSSDTVRSKSISGKPLRMLRSDWTDEWDAPGAPAALPMPVQGVLVEEAMGRIERAARHRESPAYRLLTGPAGQIIGQLTAVRRVQQVVQDIITEYIDVITALAADLAD
jgi:NAD(P)H-dependent flavin oxidoreductase YrpB (nitropropane dioxygenase family)